MGLETTYVCDSCGRSLAGDKAVYEYASIRVDCEVDDPEPFRDKRYRGYALLCREECLPQKLNALRNLGLLNE